MAVVLAVVVAVSASTLFVLSLPPSLSIHEGVTDGALLANFPTTNSATNLAEDNFTATTFANETAGPSSSLTLRVNAYGAAVGTNYVIQGVQMFYDVQVIGRFATNLRPDGLRFSFNQTAPGATAEFYNGPDVASGYYAAQGPMANVSEDQQQTFVAGDNGSGALTATLLNAGGPGPYYAFHYWANGQSYMEYRTPKFPEFRATVTGWFLPTVRVDIGVEIRNVPKIFPLFPVGTSWPVSGSASASFSVPTTAAFVVSGAFNASGPVTAYIVNVMQFPGYGGTPSSWEWTASLGTTPTPVNVTLPPPGTDWYLMFTTAGTGANVYATQAIVATA